MLETNIKTPGVYIDEINSFPDAVVPVPTAVPAFIGYTPQAEYQGNSYLNEPLKITSFEEFKAYFCYPDLKPVGTAKQYSPQYYLVKVPSEPSESEFVKIDNQYYVVIPDSNTIIIYTIV